MQIGSRKVSVYFQRRAQYNALCAVLLFLPIMLLCSLVLLPANVLAQEATPDALEEAETEEAASLTIDATPEAVAEPVSESLSADETAAGEEVVANEVTVSAILSSSQLISITLLQVETAARRISFLQDSLNNSDLPEARRHTEHIINTLDGESGLLFGDLDEDGFAQNPGDGTGVRLYLDDITSLFETISSGTVSTDTASLSIESIQDVLDALASSSEVVNETTAAAAKIFAAETVAEAQIVGDGVALLVDSVYEQNEMVQEAIAEVISDLGLGAETAEMAVLVEDTISADVPVVAQRLDRAKVQGTLAILTKAADEVEIAVDHSTFLRRSLDDADLLEARRHAEHIINIMDGKNGVLFGDLDRNGEIQNPGNGTGLRVYLGSATMQAGALSDAVNSNEAFLAYMSTAQALTASLDNGQMLMPEAFAQSLLILASDTVTESRDYAEELTAHILEIQEAITGASASTRELIEAVNDDETSGYSAPGFSNTGPPPTGVSGEVWERSSDQASYIFVPAGGFTIGAVDSVNAAANERPAHTLVLDAFWIAQAETTNAHYAKCVDAGVCSPPSNSRWDQALYADHPVTHVSWDQATTFAGWAGGRLPTEGEWEKACRGLTYRTYPWGNEQPNAELANVGGAIGTTTAVGSYPNGASRFGLFDMSGNAREWTMSVEQPYPYVVTDGREDPNAGGNRIARGGAYSQPQFGQRCTVRTPTPAVTADAETGFRIVLVAGRDVWTNPIDNATYTLIPAGEFIMGASPTDAVDSNELPKHSVGIEAFWLQETETTNARYGLCVSAGECTPPSNTLWDDAEYAEHPVTNVDWAQATAYATWVNGRLPTEAEWEKACSSTDQRLYPWGNQPPTDSLSNFNFSLGETTPVGSYPAGASPYGVLDMGGSVWEWTSSLDAGYPYVGIDGREDPEADGLRVGRGGSFYDAQNLLRCATRSATEPSTVSPQFGFRVAISDPE